MGLAPDDILNYTEEKADAMGLLWDPFTAGANSDHYYFEVVGCPVSFLHHSPDPWYHTPEDTPDKIQVDTLEENGELATAVMYDWAKNLTLGGELTLANRENESGADGDLTRLQFMAMYKF